MKIAPVPLPNGNSVVYVIPEQHDAADGLLRVHQAIANMQSGSFPHFSAVSTGTGTKSSAKTSDAQTKQMHTEPMNDITRDELDAKLDATNARVEARLAGFESTVRDTMAAVRHDSAEMRGELKAIHGDLAHLKNLKANIWGAAGAVLLAFLASALTIYFGISSNNQMLVSNAIAGFGAGKDVSAAQAEIKQLNREALELLQQIKAQQAASPAVRPPSPPSQQ